MVCSFSYEEPKVPQFLPQGLMNEEVFIILFMWLVGGGNECGGITPLVKKVQGKPRFAHPKPSSSSQCQGCWLPAKAAQEAAW